VSFSRFRSLGGGFLTGIACCLPALQISAEGAGLVLFASAAMAVAGIALHLANGSVQRECR
jgi:hypothetical protein